jgi:parallel beta-helix repeat protein
MRTRPFFQLSLIPGPAKSPCVAAVWLLGALIACAQPASVAQAQAGKAPDALPLIEVRSDDTHISSSARLRFPKEPIADLNGNGVVIVNGSGIVLECQGRLSAPAAAPETRQGIGLWLTGSDITVVGYQAAGFKVGLLASDCDRLRLLRPSIRDGFAQRLSSSPLGEAAADWLWPHENDAGQWRSAYGAAILIEDSNSIEVLDGVVRGAQNGILLERVTGGRLAGNDASFLSGWGLALWRSSQLLIEGNRFDFCVRGYAHGHYNRGQDSAGILLFEQCSHNTFRQNSACYCGDGIFGFAGREALDQPAPAGEPAERGCNYNLFEGNLLNHNVAHGLELTFSFGNLIRDNRLEGNGICGLWLGYARQTRVEGNLLRGNGDMGYGAERGGLNAEHAQELFIRDNRFDNNRLGLRFWSDADSALQSSAWVRAHGQGARRIAVVRNSFTGPEPWIELLETSAVALDGTWTEQRLSADDRSRAGLLAPELALEPPTDWRQPPADVGAARGAQAPGTAPGAERQPSNSFTRGAIELPPGAPRDRGAIVIGAYGPYDWESLYLEPEPAPPGFLGFRALGPGPAPVWSLEAGEGLALATEANHQADSLLRGRAQISAREPGCWPFVLTLRSGAEHLQRSGHLIQLAWQVRAFPTPINPLEDEAAFDAQAAAAAAVTRRDLKLRFGNQGPGALVDAPQAWAELPSDHFGLLAESSIHLPAGSYRLRTVSDDGLRVWLDGEELLADWSWHAARPLEAEFELSEARSIALKVAYCELVGAATLEVELLPGAH